MTALRLFVQGGAWPATFSAQRVNLAKILGRLHQRGLHRQLFGLARIPSQVLLFSRLSRTRRCIA